MKYYLTIESDIAIEDLDGKPLKDTEPARHVNFIMTACVDSKMTSSIAGLEAAFNVRRAMKDAKPGDVIEIEATDFEPLREAVRSPNEPLHTKLHPIVCGQVFPFIRAVLGAPTTRPGGSGV